MEPRRCGVAIECSWRLDAFLSCLKRTFEFPQRALTHCLQPDIRIRLADGSQPLINSLLQAGAPDKQKLQQFWDWSILGEGTIEFASPRYSNSPVDIGTIQCVVLVPPIHRFRSTRRGLVKKFLILIESLQINHHENCAPLVSRLPSTSPGHTQLQHHRH